MERETQEADVSKMVATVTAAIGPAGHEWLKANDPGRMTLSWADIPDEVFARAAIAAMREPILTVIAGERLEEPQDFGDEAYNRAIYHVASSVVDLLRC